MSHLRALSLASLLLHAGCFFSTGSEDGPPPGGDRPPAGDGGVEPGEEPGGEADPDGGGPPPGRDSGPADGGIPAPGDGGGLPDGGDGPDPTEPDCYREPVNPDADISDLIARYGGSDWKDELIEALGRRWPAGAALLEAQRNDSYFGTFSDPSSWTGMVGWLDTLVHEQTHLFDAYHAMAVGQPHSLFIRGDLILYPPVMDDFPRSEILPMVETPGSIYASTYLSGWQGERGFVPLLDELNAYINEMAALAVVGEHYPGHGVSSRDGAVAFLYFLELYLRRARTHHPAFHAAVVADPTVRQILEVQWLRTHFFLELSDRFPGLGIRDAEYRAAMHAPENVAELELVLGRPVGDSSCYLD